VTVVNGEDTASRSDWLSGRVRLLLAVEFLSSAGTAMVVLAVAYFTYSSSGSPFQSALTAAAYVLPAVALGFTAGRIADERDPAQTWIVFDAGKALLYLLLAVAAASASLFGPRVGV